MCWTNSIISKYLDKFVVFFINDILIYSKNKQEHEEHINIVLQFLREQNMYANFIKCHLFNDMIQYLGQVVSKDGISFDPDKIMAIAEWPVAKNVMDNIR